ncbi:arginine--tRNA ligase [Candidatus Parcubacteria bacterium]|nr:arginine--tRNA ligase [Candidatus Parcubacteria bacterium]
MMKVVMKKELENLINQVIKELSLAESSFSVEHPNDLSHGDYSTNVAMVLAKETKKNPKELAEVIKDKLLEYKSENIEKIEVAGAGFINFHLSKNFFKKSIQEIIEGGEKFGRNEILVGEKIMVEHTDPNPFKEFHIGHLMPNVIGSSLARLLEWNGAEVKQASYQGDVGLHVAKAVWAIKNGHAENSYAVGHKAYEENPEAKKEIEGINKKIYDKSDNEINKIYEDGRKASLEYFETIYKRLGTKFDFYFFESDAGKIGKEIVEENIGKIFEESDGAVVFKGDKFDPSLHTRVFINSQGLPTYEAKDLGNAKMKFDKYEYTKSIVVTGNEIKDYFRVVLEAMKMVLPNLASITKHLSHGMLRLTTGKMSSRTGNVVTAESLIDEVKEKTEGDEDVALGAIKYMILRQSIGSDIIFDINQSVSTEGDSGVYLQYAHARASSLIDKATGIEIAYKERSLVHEVEKLLYRFPEIVERAGGEYAPSYVTTYLTELASAFNNFYAHEEVIGDSPESGTRLAIVKAFKTVMKNGLDILGIPAPERI